MRTLIILFFVGFFLGPFGDFFHVLTETTTYPMDKYGLYFGPIPFWVPIQFGFAAVAVGFSHLSFDKLLGPQSIRPGARKGSTATLGLAIFLGLYLLSGLLPGSAGGSNDFLLWFLALLTWALMDWTWQGLLLAVLTSLAGTSIEMTMVHFQIFKYLSPQDNFWGVPSWLPSLYFAASVTVANFARFLNRREAF